MNNSEKLNTPEANSRFAKRSFLLMGSHLLKLFAQLSILFIYSRLLTLEEYGIYQSVWLYTNVLGVIALFGLPSIILAYPIEVISSWIFSNRNRLSLWVLLLQLIPVIFLFFIAEGFGLMEKSLLLILVLFQNFSVIIETIAVKQMRERRVLFLNLVYYVLFLALHLFLIYYGYSLTLLLAGLAGLTLVKSFFLLPYNIKRQSSALSRDLPGQWIFLGMYDVVGVLFRWLDKWIILFYVSTAQFAIYFNGAYEIPVFALMLSAVGSIMVVELSKGDYNGSKIMELFQKSSRLLASIVFPAFAFLLFYHEEFFTFLFSNKYVESIPVFLVAIFVLPVRIVNFTAALQVNERNDIVFKGALFDLIAAIIFVLILYPFFGVRGLAASFVISTYLQAAYYIYHTSRLPGINWKKLLPFDRLTWMIVTSLFVAGLTYFLSASFGYPSNMIAGMIITGCLVIVYLYLYRNNIKGYAV